MSEYTTHRTKDKIVLIVNGYEMANVPISRGFAVFIAKALIKNAKNLGKYTNKEECE